MKIFITCLFIQLFFITGLSHAEFNDSGVALIEDLSANSYVQYFTEDIHGNYLVSYGSKISGDDFIGVIKFNSEGELDTSFGLSGFSGVSDHCGDDMAELGHILMTNNGTRPLVMGFGPYFLPGYRHQVFLAQFLENGLINNLANTTSHAFAAFPENCSSGGINGGVAKVDAYQEMSDTNENLVDANFMLDADGNILVFGMSKVYGYRGLYRESYILTISKLDGTLGAADTSFGADGTGHVELQVRTWTYPSSIALQSDGKILVGGSAINRSGGYYYFIARLTAEGILDESFGELNPDGSRTGIIEKSSGGSSNDIISHLFPSSGSDGSLYAFGVHDGVGKFTLFKFKENGSVDHSFGVNGMVHYDDFSMEYSGRSFKSINNHIVKHPATDSFYIINEADDDVVVTKIDSDGSIDSLFGEGLGKVVVDISGDEKEDEVDDALINKDGYLVILGEVEDAHYLLRLNLTTGAVVSSE
jgi:uncharacterized delta-60 repeat protein